MIEPIIDARIKKRDLLTRRFDEHLSFIGFSSVAMKASQCQILRVVALIRTDMVDGEFDALPGFIRVAVFAKISGTQPDVFSDRWR